MASKVSETPKLLSEAIKEGSKQSDQAFGTFFGPLTDKKIEEYNLAFQKASAKQQMCELPLKKQAPDYLQIKGINKCYSLRFENYSLGNSEVCTASLYAPTYVVAFEILKVRKISAPVVLTEWLGLHITYNNGYPMLQFDLLNDKYYIELNYPKLLDKHSQIYATLSSQQPGYTTSFDISINIWCIELQ